MTDTIQNNRRVFTPVGYDELAINKNVSTRAFILYVYLSLRTGRNAECWPSYNTIAEDTGLSKPTIREAVNDLIEAGLLTYEAGNSERSNHYTIREGVVKNLAYPMQETLPELESGNKTTLLRNGETSSPPQSSLVSASIPDTAAARVHAEYERLQYLGFGLRETAIGLVRYAGTEKTKNNKQDMQALGAALGIVWRLCFGDRVEPEYGRLFAIARKLGGYERLVTTMLDVATREVLGNPHDVLEKWRPAWQRKENEQPTGRAWGT